MSGQGQPQESEGAMAEAMEDEVSRLVAGWGKALPDVDVSPLEVLSRVTRLARHLDRQRTSVLARHDLEIWTFDVLAALRRSDPPHQLSPGQLMAQTLVTSGTMTNRIDHLEQRGLVRRRPDPLDARSGGVQLTPAGRRRVGGARKDLVARENGILRTLDGDGRTTLGDLLRRVVAPFDA